ncbi:MAG: PIG-L deacetylase family protein [Campylobacterota bacterium]|nr:PIG-L deacetylase family protein [Campylobacterota bacterium]
MLSNEKNLKLVAIGAHPDDIELACGGTLAKAKENGHEVDMIIVTGSSSKDHNDNYIRTEFQAKGEQSNAAEVLGVKNVHILEFEDMSVPYSKELVSRLDEIINDIQPDVVFTHFVFDTHQDHIHTAQSTLSAARKQNTVLLYEPINPSGRGYIPFRAQVYFDITNTIDKKLNSLKAHKSQYKKYGENWIESIKARAKFRGFEIGSEYAECFELVRMEVKL